MATQRFSRRYRAAKRSGAPRLRLRSARCGTLLLTSLMAPPHDVRTMPLPVMVELVALVPIGPTIDYSSRCCRAVKSVWLGIAQAKSQHVLWHQNGTKRWAGESPPKHGAPPPRSPALEELLHNADAQLPHPFHL